MLLLSFGLGTVSGNSKLKAIELRVELREVTFLQYLNVVNKEMNVGTSRCIYSNINILIYPISFNTKRSFNAIRCLITNRTLFITLIL